METILSLPIRIGIMTLAVGLWLAIFFGVKALKIAPQRRMDLISPIDRKIPFWPKMSLVYFSTYVFVLLPFVMLSESRYFWGILACYLAVTLISTAFHIALPSRVQRQENLAVNGLSTRLLAWFQGFSKPHDNFPSMHVAFSVLTVGVGYALYGPWMGTAALVWAVLIALSTMFTKQHYLIDVLAGTINGLIIFSVGWMLLA